MKTLVSLVVLSLIVAGSGIGLYLRRESQAAALRLQHQEALAEKLTQQLELLQERLEGVERATRAAPVAAVAPAAAGSTRGAGSEDEPEEETAEAAAAGEEASDDRAQAFTRQLLASLGRDGEQDFRDYVRKVYLDERDARREREAAEAEARRKEMEELSKGPYGNYNRRVNTLGKQLGMDDRQKQRYHDLLASYHSRHLEMRKAVDWKDQTARQRFRDDENALQGEFDAHVARLLDQQQAEEYASLDPGEKRVASADSGAVVFKFGEAVAGGGIAVPDIMMAGGRAEAAIRVIGAAEEAALDLKVKLAEEAARAAAAEKQALIKIAPPAGE
jgi:hypothetical protein